MDRLIKDRECCELLSISRTSWWVGVRNGLYPKQIRLGERTSRWKLSEVMAIIENGAGDSSEGSAKLAG